MTSTELYVYVLLPIFTFGGAIAVYFITGRMDRREKHHAAE